MGEYARGAMIIARIALTLAAAVCFALAADRLQTRRFDLVATGLALLALAMLIQL